MAHLCFSAVPLITPPLPVFLLFFLSASLTILIWPLNHWRHGVKNRPHQYCMSRSG